MHDKRTKQNIFQIFRVHEQKDIYHRNYLVVYINEQKQLPVLIHYTDSKMCGAKFFQIFFVSLLWSRRAIAKVSLSVPLLFNLLIYITHNLNIQWTLMIWYRLY